MDASTFATLNQGLITGGYIAMFIAILIEGPSITAAGAFAAKLGYFNIWIVFLLSILGNLIPDIFLYAVGFFGRARLIDTYGHYFGVTKEHVLLIEKLYERHAIKTLLVSKLVPFLAPPGLIAAGAVRMPIKKYTLWSLLIILPTSGLFLALGYYFGTLYKQLAGYEEYMLAAAVITIVVITYGYRKLAKKLGEKIENIEVNQ